MGKRYDSIHAAICMAAAAMRLDANETAIFARQLEDIDSKLYEVEYPELIGTKIVPVKSDIDPGAEEYTYDVMDYAGRMAPIANYADDLPSSDLQGFEVTTKLKSWGGSYGYSIQDLRRAKMAGRPLENIKAKTQRDIAARQLDEIIFSGYSSLGITGLVNNANVSLVTPITGTWTSATALQILADLFKLERTAFEASKGVEMPDTLLLPTTRFSLLNQPLGDNADKTILDFFKSKSLFVKNVEHSFRLETANVAGTGPRAVCYRKDPTKLEALVPVEFETFPPEAKNLAFKVNAHMRCGGVIVRYPGSMRYMDGI